jgi:hypothetical protein
MNETVTNNRHKLITTLAIAEELTKTTRQLHETLSNIMRGPELYNKTFLDGQLDNIDKTLSDVENSLSEVDMTNLIHSEDILHGTLSSEEEFPEVPPPVLPEGFTDVTQRVPFPDSTHARPVTAKVTQGRPTKKTKKPAAKRPAAKKPAKPRNTKKPSSSKNMKRLPHQINKNDAKARSDSR